MNKETKWPLHGEMHEVICPDQQPKGPLTKICQATMNFSVYLPF